MKQKLQNIMEIIQNATTMDGQINKIKRNYANYNEKKNNNNNSNNVSIYYITDSASTLTQRNKRVTSYWQLLNH